MKSRKLYQDKKGFIFLDVLFVAVGVMAVIVYLFKNQNIVNSLAEAAFSFFK